MMNSKWENESAKEVDKDFYYMDVFSGRTRNQRRQVEGKLKLKLAEARIKDLESRLMQQEHQP